MQKQKPKEVDIATLPIHQQASYRQGYQDYESSVQNNQLSISKSNYNPAAETDAFYRAGWEQAADDHHRNLARREGLRSIIMGIVAMAFGVGAGVVVVVTSMNSMGSSDLPMTKQTGALLLAGSLMAFGTRMIWRGINTISSSGQEEDHDGDQPWEL